MQGHSPAAPSSVLVEPHTPDRASPLLNSSTLLPGPQQSTWRFTCWLVVAGKHRWWPARFFQACIMSLIVCNVVLVIIDTDPYFDTDAGTDFDAWFVRFEIVSVVIFSVEYALRLWSCAEAPKHRSRLRWALSPLALVDLVSLMPYIVDLALPRGKRSRVATLVVLLRTFSLLRMERAFKSFKSIARVLAHKGEELLVSAFIAIIMLILSSSLMYFVENPDGLGPGHGTKFTSIGNAMWWSVAALTTTGYGDLVPTTPVGQFLGGIAGFLGLLFFALPAGIISSGFVETMIEEKQRRKDAIRSLPAFPHSRDNSPNRDRASPGGPLRRMQTVGSLESRFPAAGSSDSSVWSSGALPQAAGGEAGPRQTSTSQQPHDQRGSQRGGGERASTPTELEALVLRQVLSALDGGLPALATSIARERLTRLGHAPAKLDHGHGADEGGAGGPGEPAPGSRSARFVEP